MKNYLFLALVLLAGACKDKKDPEPEKPRPVQYGKINFNITPYDSLGYPEKNRAGIPVYLVEDKVTLVTDSAGAVSFSNLPYGNHTPVLTKDKYDGPVVTVYLNAPEYTSNLPFPRHSHYEVANFKSQLIDQNNIYVSFNLSPAVPADSSVKMVLLAHYDVPVTERTASSFDVFTVNKTVNTDYNISVLPNFRSFIASRDSGSSVYVTVAPVSYGLYKSNLQTTPQVLGEGLIPAGTLKLTKNWNN